MQLLGHKRGSVIVGFSIHKEAYTFRTFTGQQPVPVNAHLLPGYQNGQKNKANGSNVHIWEPRILLFINASLLVLHQ